MKAQVESAYTVVRKIDYGEDLNPCPQQPET